MKRSVKDAHPEVQVGVPTDEVQCCPAAWQQTPDEELLRSQTPQAITTQQGVDGYREKAMRLASVEHIELGNMEVVSHGSCA